MLSDLFVVGLNIKSSNLQERKEKKKTIKFYWRWLKCIFLINLLGTLQVLPIKISLVYIEGDHICIDFYYYPSIFTHQIFLNDWHGWFFIVFSFKWTTSNFLNCICDPTMQLNDHYSIYTLDYIHIYTM
jgi:hypothetical protein